MKEVPVFLDNFTNYDVLDKWTNNTAPPDVILSINNKYLHIESDNENEYVGHVFNKTYHNYILRFDLRINTYSNIPGILTGSATDVINNMNLDANIVWGVFFDGTTLSIFNGDVGTAAGRTGNWTNNIEKWVNVKLISQISPYTSATGKLHFFFKLLSERIWTYNDYASLDLTTYNGDLKGLALGIVAGHLAGVPACNFDIKNLVLNEIKSVIL